MKYLKHIYVLFTFLFFYSCSANSRMMDKEMPSDFYFIINTGADDSYNSKTGLYTRDFIEGEKTFEIVLTEYDLKAIYDLFRRADFQSLPETFEMDNYI